MPIKGLTDQKSITAGSGLPIVGRLYKGGEKTAKAPGKDLDYFRVEFEPQFKHLQSVWDDLYGAEPTEFRVFLTAPTTDQAFPTWMEEWNASGLLHRCDGEHQHAHMEQGQISRERIACAAKCQCTRVGRLYMLLPDFVEASGALGLFVISTHSINDIITIHRYLSTMENMAGRLSGIPFTFGRAERDVSMPSYKDKTMRSKQKKSMLYIHVDEDFTRNKLLPVLGGQQPAGLPAPQMQLTSGQTIDVETGEIFDDEPLEPTPGNIWHDKAHVESWLKKMVALHATDGENPKLEMYNALLAATGSPASTPVSDMLAPHGEDYAEKLIVAGQSLMKIAKKHQVTVAEARRSLLEAASTTNVVDAMSKFDNSPADTETMIEAHLEVESPPEVAQTVVDDRVVKVNVDTHMSEPGKRVCTFFTEGKRTASGTKNQFVVAGWISSTDWNDYGDHDYSKEPLPVQLRSDADGKWHVFKVQPDPALAAVGK